VSAAGNQLIGESLHLGKPLLVLPERAHSEQLMNSSFLAAMGCGDVALLEEVTPTRVRGFLDQLGSYAPALASVAGRMDGTPDVLRIIARRLAAGADAATAQLPG
jgi:UDP:flavonoid glycosyltransferase YjiC (YdhE family)